MLIAGEEKGKETLDFSRWLINAARQSLAHFADIDLDLKSNFIQILFELLL